MFVVLGATGKTGRVVSALLRERSDEAVRVVTRSAERGARMRGDAGGGGRFQAAVARLDDAEQVARALRGAGAVYAVLPDDLSAEAFHAGRLAMANAMAQAIEQERVARVVLLSSSTAALGEHASNGFGSALAYFERTVLQTGAAVSVLRAGWFQDNLVPALPLAARDGVHVSLLELGDARIGTIAACDVGAIAARALLAPAPAGSEIVDLVGPAYGVAEMAAALRDAVRRPVSILALPRVAREQMLRGWMSREAAGAMLETCDCLASGRVALRGDRIEHGFTTLDAVLRGCATLEDKPTAIAAGEALA
jgi:uncharacterized protein YbjT (DUF2867 family)